MWIDDEADAYPQIHRNDDCATFPEPNKELDFDTLCSLVPGDFDQPFEDISDDTILKLLPTSGTTGSHKPKLVIVTEGC